MKKKPHQVAGLLLTLAMAACGGDGDSPTQGGNPGTPETPGTQPENPKPETPEPGKPDPVAKVLLEENFDGLSALPAGWSMLAASKGTVSVANGQLVIDGRAHDTSMTSVVLPAALQNLSNYRIDVVFTFESPNNTGRWGSVMYRTSDASAAFPYDPYYQFAIRSAATASNGTEFALRKNNAWNVTGTKSG